MDGEQEDKRNAFERFGESFLDAAAQKNPFLAGLRGAVQTQGWKEEQAYKNLQKKDKLLDVQKKQNELDEWNKNAPVREQNRELMFRKNRFAFDAMDQKEENDALGVGMVNLRKQLSANPEFSRLNLDEADGLLKSPSMTAMIQSKFYLDKVMQMANGDKNAYAFLERAMRRNEYKLEDGENGLKYLKLPSGKKYPANPDGVKMIQGEITQAAMDEMNARIAISESSANMSPVNRSVSQWTQSFTPYTGGRAAIAMERVQRIMNGATEKGKLWHFINRAIRDFSNPGIASDVKMNGLAQCIPILQKLGYNVDGYDPKNPSIETIQIKDPKNEKNISFLEFAEIARDKDNLSRVLEKELGLAQDAAVMAQNKKAMLFQNEQAKRIKASMEMRKLALAERKAGTGDGESDGSSGSQDEREADARNAAKEESQFGIKFVKDHNLGGHFETIWRNSKNNKYIKSRDDLARIFGIAYKIAETAFGDTEDYKKAQEAFETTLSKYGIADSYIPDVFGDLGMKQEKRKLEEETKSLMKGFNGADVGKKHFTNYDAKSLPFVDWNPSEVELNKAKRKKNAERINEIDSFLQKKAKKRQEEMKRRKDRMNKFNQRKI